jgi:Flp pilus assembly protein TadD
MTLQSLPSLSTRRKRFRNGFGGCSRDRRRPDELGGLTRTSGGVHGHGPDGQEPRLLRKASRSTPERRGLQQLGAALNGKGRHAESIPWFRKAIALDPTDSLAHSNLGEALASQGHLDEGIACYRKAIELDPRDAYAYAVLGDALRTQGEEDAAIASYRKSVELDPNRAEPYVFLGELLLKRGKADEGPRCLRKPSSSTRSPPGCGAGSASRCMPIVRSTPPSRASARHEIDPTTPTRITTWARRCTALGRPADALPSYREPRSSRRRARRTSSTSL